MTSQYYQSGCVLHLSHDDDTLEVDSFFQDITCLPHGDLGEAGGGSRFASHQKRSKLKFQDSVAIGTTTPCTHRALCSSDLRSTVSEL